MSKQEQELLDLFNTISAPLPGSKTLHAITLDGFKHAVKWATQKAFLQGQQEGLNKATSIVNETFKPL